MATDDIFKEPPEGVKILKGLRNYLVDNKATIEKPLLGLIDDKNAKVCLFRPLFKPSIFIDKSI